MPDDDQSKMQRFREVRPDWLTTGAKRPKREETPEQAVETPWEDPPEPPTRRSKLWSFSWVTTITLISLVAVIGIAFHLRKSGPSIVPKPAPTRMSATERRAAAEKTVLAFFAAESDEERLSMILTPDRLRDSLVEYYSREGSRVEEPAEITVAKLHFVTINDEPWCWAQLADPNHKTTHAALKETAEGYLIDWESLVAYGEMSWSSLLERRPAKPTQMRVRVAFTPYYNYKYDDRTRYAAFRIEGQSDSSWLYGYVERGSPTHRALQLAIRPGTKQPANIRLHFEPDAGADNLVVIDELIHARWTAPELLGARTNTALPAE